MAHLLDCPYVYLTMETDLSKVPEQKEEIKRKIDQLSPVIFQSNQQIFDFIMEHRFEQRAIEIMQLLMENTIEEGKIDLIKRIIERIVKKSKDFDAMQNQEEYVHELFMKKMGEEREKVLKAVLEEVNQAGLAYLNYILDVMRQEEHRERYCYSQNFMWATSRQLNWDIDQLNAILYYTQEENLHTVYIETDKRFVEVFQLQDATVSMFCRTKEMDEAQDPAEERRVFELSFYSTDEPESDDWILELDVTLSYYFANLRNYVPEQLRETYEDVVANYFNGTDWKGIIKLEF